MNLITIHGKVVNPAKTIMVTRNGVSDTVVSFAIVDIGLPYRMRDNKPLFIQVNYRKSAADLICGYLTKDKEIIVYGSLCERFTNAASGKQARYYIEATAVELVPLFNKSANKEEK